MTDRAELEAQVVERALKDEAFKRALLEEPRTVLKREFGVKLDPNLKVTVLEVGPDDLYVVLPSPPEDVESSSAEDLVAKFGGEDPERRKVAGMVVRAWRDPEFKRSLSDDPAAVLERELGTPVPAGAVCHVLEEDAEHRYMLLPALSTDLAAQELPDEELETVAGGTLYNTAYCVGDVGILGTSVMPGLGYASATPTMCSAGRC